jgi:hypothetical protein
MRNAPPLKQRIVFVAALVIALFVGNLVSHFANRFNPYRTDEIHYTAGLEAMPVILVAARAINFLALGYLERNDQRGYLVLTGRLSHDKEKTARTIDLILSISAVACVVGFSTWVSRKVARNV